jgi:hypothetical protein
MKNYQDIKANFSSATSLTICLNSLAKLGELDEDELENYIVYIDEVSSFLEFTHNDTLDSILKDVFVLLSRLVKHAKKVIVSDALINDNTFEFLKNRRPETTIMLSNSFQKFQNVPAVRLRDENVFLQKLVEHCNSDKPFLFGSDSCEVVTRFYHRSLDQVTEPTLKDKFVLVTAETDVRFRDVSEDWKGKFVFFSPKVTFGVDFSAEVPQDTFIYIKGNSITPAGLFQQATRTRNIATLYYHGEVGNGDCLYENLDQVCQNVEHCLSVSKSLASTCTYVDECDQLQFVHNSFFKMFCYTEFVKDIFGSNKVKHFETFLAQNGFSLSTEGTPEKLRREERSMQKELVEAIAEEHFEEFLKTDNVFQPKFANLMKNITYLHVDPADHETLGKFKSTLVNKYRVQEHDAILRLLKCTEYIDAELARLSAKSMDAKLLTNNFQKAKIIREFNAKFGLNLFNLQEASSEEATMDDDFFKLVQHTFSVKRAKPSNFHEIKQLFVSIVRSATTKDLIKSKQGKSKKDRDETLYLLNESLLRHHLELNAFKNKRRTNFAPDTVEKFNLEVATFQCDGFADDLDC